MEESLSRRILAKIRAKREERKISRKNFAASDGIPERTLTAIEMGETTKIPAELILKGCMILDIDITEFVNPEKFKEKQDKMSQERVIELLDKLDKIDGIEAKMDKLIDFQERFNDMFGQLFTNSQDRAGQLNEPRDKEKGE